MPYPIMRIRVAWHDPYTHLHTASALHTLSEPRHEDVAHPEGDLVMQFWGTLLRGAAWDGVAGLMLEENVGDFGEAS